MAKLLNCTPYRVFHTGLVVDCWLLTRTINQYLISNGKGQMASDQNTQTQPYFTNSKSIVRRSISVCNTFTFTLSPSAMIRLRRFPITR